MTSSAGGMMPDQPRPPGEMRSVPPPVPGGHRSAPIQSDPDSLGWIGTVAPICAVAAILAFGVSLLTATENAVVGILGMGFSAVVCVLAVIATLLADLRSEVRVLTERRRRCRIAEQRRRFAEQQAEFDAQSAQRDRRWKELGAKAKQRAGHLAEIRRGQWRRFWRAVFSVPVAIDDAIGGLVGRENKILRNFMRGIFCLAALGILVVVGAIVATVFPPDRKVTTPQQSDTQEEADANANLIAAAPAQNAALERAREDINWMLNNRKFLNPEVFDYIDEALLGAEGR